jgi:uncharacterized protein
VSNDPPTQPSNTDAVVPLRARLSVDLRAAMKARDQAAIVTVRCLLAVLDNAGAQDPIAYPAEVFGIEVPRKALTQHELQTLLQAEITSRSAAISDYERGGRHQDAARLRAELILLSRYLAP